MVEYIIVDTDHKVAISQCTTRSSMHDVFYDICAYATKQYRTWKTERGAREALRRLSLEYPSAMRCMVVEPVKL